MPTARMDWNVSVDIDGDLDQIGGIASLAGMTAKFKRTISVAASGSDTLFNIDTECLGDFDLLIIASDYDLAIELITDDDADVGEAIFSLETRGSGITNQLGWPLVIPKDDSLANHTVGFNGTWDVIERIECKNRSSTQAVKVTLLAVT